MRRQNLVLVAKAYACRNSDRRAVGISARVVSRDHQKHGEVPLLALVAHSVMQAPAKLDNACAHAADAFRPAAA